MKISTSFKFHQVSLASLKTISTKNRINKTAQLETLIYEEEKRLARIEREEKSNNVYKEASEVTD